MNVILVSWIRVRSTEYNFGLLNTKAKHWIKLWLTDYKNPHIEHKIVVTYWIIRKKIVGNRNKQLKKCKHDHDQIKGDKLTFFCVDELFSNSELLCSVDFCRFIAMLEAQNIVKGFQVHPFWICTWRMTFDKANSWQPADRNRIISSQLLNMRKK